MAHAEICAACTKTLVDVRRNLSMATVVRSALDLAESHGTHQSPMGMVGRAFDGFTIVRVLGSGSSATVYEAVQDGTRRRVALKVLSTFAMSPGHLRRFEHEAMVLARLRHPGIAQVLGTGTINDDAGSRPYIAMELVDGQPITDHAAAHGVGRHGRLALVAEAADALHHAHACGIVHRDVKPGNVLVTREAGGEGGGSVRIVDFGFARLTGPQTMLSTMHTADGNIVGTVAYMSPEHIAGASAVDARSDVYALGVIAHEMLTGRLPIVVRDMPLERAIRAIAEVDPERLSRIDGSLAGDIETVVARALAKRPQDRYQTAAEFGADLRRVIAGEPIGARRPGPIKRAHRFVRQHNALATGVAAVVVTLLIGLAGTSFGLARALERTRIAEERRRSAEELARLLNGMLREAHPHEAKGRGYTVRQMLDDFSRRFEAGIPDQPVVEAALRTTMGTGYRVLGEYGLARPHLERALELRRSADPPSPDDVASAACDLAQLEHDESAYDRAIALFDEVQGMEGAHPQTRARALLGWADCLHHAGDPRAALDRGRIALEAALANHAAAPDDERSAIGVAEARITLSRILRDTGDLDSAERELREGVGLLEDSIGRDDPRVANALNDQAWVAFLRRDYDLAESTVRAAMELGARTLGEDHPDLANSKYELALILAMQGKRAEGEPLMRQALDIYLRAHGEHHPSTFQAQESLARILRTLDRSEESLELLERALAGRRVFFGDQSVEVGFALSAMAQAQRDLRDLEGAERSALEALKIYRAVYPKPHNFTARALGILGAIAMDRGDAVAAQRWYEESASVMELAVGKGHADTLACNATLAECLESRADWTGALAKHDLVLARCGEGTPAVRRALAHQGRGRCLMGMGRAADAVADHREALEILVGVGSAGTTMAKRIAAAREELATAQERAGDIAGAAATRAAQVPPAN
jgi:tetratricopeptide (TPR) repeat protein